MPAITGMPICSSSACRKKQVPWPRRLAYIFSCSGSFTPEQFTSQTSGMCRILAMSVTRRLLSGWPAIHAPAIHLLLNPMRTHHLPRMRARPSTTPVLPDSSFSGSKMLCSGQKVPGSTRYAMRSQTLISPRSCRVCKETPTFLMRSTSASMVCIISSILAQFSRMLSICLADSGFPSGSIFSKYGFMLCS